jgi:simple sugar transport system permease protein
MSTTTLISNSIVRIGMQAVFVLAMLPTIQSGIGLNFGLPLGILCGLVGGLITVEHNMTGFMGLFTAILTGIPLAIVVGISYGWLLNNMKGSEMTVGNYLNFSVISLMCVGWMVLPFRNKAIVWAMGNGVRSTITLEANYEHVLDDFLKFSIAGIEIPTGTLLAVGILCVVMWIYMHSKTGVLMRCSGENPVFGASLGINNDRMRIVSTTISTTLGAVGIIIYSQSYGFYQLYTAPQMMAYPAIAAILIGGATTKKATILNVILGVVLYQSLLTIVLPIASELLSNSNLSEILRTIVSNGIILYALTKMGGIKL